MRERTKLVLMLAGFAGCWFLPLEQTGSWGAIHEALALTRWYAREHVLLCLVPAFFIAGAIAVFVSQGAVMRYLGPSAPRTVAYPVAAASGTILAVCSCTVLPLFASIHKRGAGLGPATAFLYSGPAINVLAIILTAAVLGPSLGLARALGAVLFAVAIGLSMHAIFHRSEAARSAQAAPVVPDDGGRSLAKDATVLGAMVAILVFANWSAPQSAGGIWALIYAYKWLLTAIGGVVLAVGLMAWFERDELADWCEESWSFAKQILPLLLAGVVVAGLLLGGPGGGEGLLPSDWIARSVGGNSLASNAFAAVAGALMYFATLTEVPILEGLLGSGMGDGPALTLLLAGPALSLPNMLVIRSVLGTRMTLTYIGLVVVFSTAAGLVYGAIL